MPEPETESAHLRSDYDGGRESAVAVCGIAPPQGDVFTHPEDVTCPGCIDRLGECR